jgi:hypothetical protein
LNFLVIPGVYHQFSFQVVLRPAILNIACELKEKQKGQQKTDDMAAFSLWFRGISHKIHREQAFGAVHKQGEKNCAKSLQFQGSDSCSN